MEHQDIIDILGRECYIEAPEDDVKAIGLEHKYVHSMKKEIAATHKFSKLIFVGSDTTPSYLAKLAHVACGMYLQSIPDEYSTRLLRGISIINATKREKNIYELSYETRFHEQLTN